MCIIESSNVIFEEVKISEEVQIDYEEEQDEVVVKTSTLP